MHKKNHTKKTLGPKASYLLSMLYELNKPVFRLRDVKKILNLEKKPSSSFIHHLVNRGVVSRLKPGLYTIVPFELGAEKEYTGNPLVVAREIMNGKDYYISHGSAMEIHGMLSQPQLIFSVTTLKQKRSVNALGIQFRFIHSQKKFFFGFSNHWATKQEQVRVSDIEKTVIDGLRQPEYCGGLTEVAKGLWIRHRDMNINRLIKYATKMGVGAVIGRLGFLMELYKIGTHEHREILREQLTETYARLDPILPFEGKFLRRWRLRLNVSREELLTVIRT